MGTPTTDVSAKKALPSYKQLCNIPKQKVRIETASIVMVWIMLI